MTKKTPTGVCGVVIDNGEVICSVTDFHRSPAGGYGTINDGQRSRCRDLLKSKFFVLFVGPRLSANVDTFLVDQVWKHAEKLGFKMHFMDIGGDEA